MPAGLKNFDPNKYADEYIKVPFKEALSLVSSGKIFMHRGFAYVHLSELSAIAKNQFKNRLTKELTKAYNHLQYIFSDERIKNIILKLGNHNEIDFNITEITAPKDSDKIRLADLDYHQRNSFPPCMKTLYTSLRN